MIRIISARTQTDRNEQWPRALGPGPLRTRGATLDQPISGLLLVQPTGHLDRTGVTNLRGARDAYLRDSNTLVTKVRAL